MIHFNHNVRDESTTEANFVKQEAEVEALLEVKLSDFLNGDNVVTKTVTFANNTKVEVPAYNLNNHLVWGATAMMLSEIKDLLKTVH